MPLIYFSQNRLITCSIASCAKRTNEQPRKRAIAGFDPNRDLELRGQKRRALDFKLQKRRLDLGIGRVLLAGAAPQRVELVRADDCCRHG